MAQESTQAEIAANKHVDVVIVGAGLSGIGAAVHLQDKCPGKSYTILEGREALGGTWDLFRYPGIRSDSDMHTLGYNFKPWKAAKSIADGPSIRSYVQETADEHGILRNICFNHRVKSAAWSTDDSNWVIEAESGEDSQPVTFTCNFLFMCGGYYSYQSAHTPDFEGQDDFKGQVIHPQFWPEELDYTDKNVVVIGSGATAMTLVPAMAEKGARVTMVQRSPTYVASAPDEDRVANTLRKFLPEKWAYAITRFKNIQFQRYFYNQSRSNPAAIKKRLLKMVEDHLGRDMVQKHFTPDYNPWDERMCLIPNADLFDALKKGTATVVTGHIDRFTPSGIRMQDGEDIPADIIVTATGLNLVVLSGVKFTVDGEEVNFADKFSYKGMLYSDVPNLAQTFGYINASWTLRADLTSEYVCRLLNRMDDLHKSVVTPRLRPEDANMEARPWIVDFTPGYMQRIMHLFPKQGDGPWQNTQNYSADKKMVREAPIDDDALIFSAPSGQKETAKLAPEVTDVQQDAA